MAINPVDLTAQRILITGATGFVAAPLVAALAKQNTVFAAARFSDESQRDKIEALGAIPVVLDLAADEWQDLPENIDYVINMAVAKSGKWELDLRINAQGLGRLMLHYQDVKGFLHISSTAVYEYAGHEPRCEDSALGDNHRNLFETYSISKIAAETVAQFTAKAFNIPLTVARLNVPYGPFACWPYFHLLMMQNKLPIDIHPKGPNGYSPIHSDDIIAKIPYLLAAANADTEIVNLAGDEVVSIEQWCAYMSELTGLTPQFNKTEKALGNLSCDTTKLKSLSGASQVDWKDGIKAMIATMAADALL